MSKTTIPTGGLADAAVTTAKITDANITTAKIADDAVTSAKATGIGISVCGQFRITSNQAGDQDPLNAWEENDDATYARVGSAVTQSSGIFSFPSTGIYLIIWDVACNSTSGTDKSSAWEIYMTTDNSSYTKIARNTESFSDTYQYKNTNSSVMVDVTNTSNDKVKFVVSGTNSVVQTNGNSTQNQTAVTFLRVGDT
tara:strand:+ start:61 stop:651 length:591 start_codon:yes stop_codon:yes gene_type:complete